MANIDHAVRLWAARGAVRSTPELALVIVAGEDAWREGASTRDALEYCRRRIRHLQN